MARGRDSKVKDVGQVCDSDNRGVPSGDSSTLESGLNRKSVVLFLKPGVDSYLKSRTALHSHSATQNHLFDSFEP